MSIIDDIKESYRNGDMLQRLIYVNVGVFIAYFILFDILGRFVWPTAAPDWFYAILRALMVPASLSNLILQPWSLFSYMFLHFGFLHLLFNMVWLYFGGQIFKEYLGSRKLLSTYLLGGLAGAVAYIVAFNIFPIFQGQLAESRALGASASVLAIVVAASTYAPNLKVRLFLFGEVRMKHIAIAAVVLDVISLSGTSNIGGHIAHLGGAIYGYFMVRALKSGKDYNEGFERLLDRLVSAFKPGKKSRARTVYRGPVKEAPKSDDGFRHQRAERQRKINVILDKISESGYDSLSKEEKEFLFKEGK